MTARKNATFVPENGVLFSLVDLSYRSRTRDTTTLLLLSAACSRFGYDVDFAVSSGHAGANSTIRSGGNAGAWTIAAVLNLGGVGASAAAPSGNGGIIEATTVMTGSPSEGGFGGTNPASFGSTGASSGSLVIGGFGGAAAVSSPGATSGSPSSGIGGFAGAAVRANATGSSGSGAAAGATATGSSGSSAAAGATATGSSGSSAAAGATAAGSAGVAGTTNCVPTPEICDGIDNDCNGLRDDLSTLGQLCTSTSACLAGLCQPIDAICIGYQWSNHAYAFCEPPVVVDFPTASAACAGSGAHVVTLGTAEEDAAIRSLITSKSTDIWIGLTRDSACQWNWITGEPTNYLGWSAGYPDSSCGAFDCCQLWGKSGGIWDDTRCSSGRNYVCEWGE